MKRASLAFLMLTIGLCAASADVFQFKIRFGGGLSDLAYAVVTVPSNPDFRGRTDKLGRIMLKLPNGTYDVKLVEDRKEYKATVKVGGDKTLKVVVAEP